MPITLKQAQKKFKKHYNYAMKLKEDGKAWEREMKKCEKYKLICFREYNKGLN